MSKSWLQLSVPIWDLGLLLRWGNQSEVHSTTQLTRNSLKLALERSWDHNQLSSCQVVKSRSLHIYSLRWWFQHILIYVNIFRRIWSFFDPFLTFSVIFRGQDFVVGSAVWRRWVVESCWVWVEHVQLVEHMSKFSSWRQSGRALAEASVESRSI